MSIEEQMGVDTIHVRAHVAWKHWVNIMHGEVPTALVPEDIVSAFKDVWYPKDTSPASISKFNEFAKWLVQQAFLTGFQEGFANRILKGDVNEHTK